MELVLLLASFFASVKNTPVKPCIGCATVTVTVVHSYDKARIAHSRE